MKILIAVPFMLLLLEGCDGAPQKASTGQTVGRYKFEPAAGEMPALLVDTTTGCIETITSFEKSDDSRETVLVYGKQGVNSSRSTRVLTRTLDRCKNKEWDQE